jgi:hypothetical protein
MLYPLVKTTDTPRLYDDYGIGTRKPLVERHHVRTLKDPLIRCDQFICNCHPLLDRLRMTIILEAQFVELDMGQPCYVGQTSAQRCFASPG